MYNFYAKVQQTVTENIHKIAILVLVATALDFLEKFPYVNTLLAFPYPWNSFLILFVLAVVLFNLRESFSFSVALLFWGIAALLSVFGKERVAGSVGTITYSLIVFGVVQMTLRNWLQKRKA